MLMIHPNFSSDKSLFSNSLFKLLKLVATRVEKEKKKTKCESELLAFSVSSSEDQWMIDDCCWSFLPSSPLTQRLMQTGQRCCRRPDDQTVSEVSGFDLRWGFVLCGGLGQRAHS